MERERERVVNEKGGPNITRSDGCRTKQKWVKAISFKSEFAASPHQLSAANVWRGITSHIQSEIQCGFKQSWLTPAKMVEGFYDLSEKKSETK
jgi:hypothetical protein